MIRFEVRLREELKKRGLSLNQMEFDTKIDHGTFSPRRMRQHSLRRSTIMAVAYYLQMKGEDLVDGTDMEDVWYD